MWSRPGCVAWDTSRGMGFGGVGGAGSPLERSEHNVPSSPWELVLGGEADLDAAQELTRQQYGPDTLAHPDYWRWLVHENPAGQAQVYIARSNGQVVGVFMLIPVRLKVGDRVLAVNLVANGLVRPDYRGRGVIGALGSWAVRDCVERGAACCFAAPGPSTRGVWRKMGFEEIGPVSPLMLKPLDVGKLLAYKGVNSRVVHRLAGAADRMVSALLQSRRPSPPDAALIINEIVTFDERFDRFWERVKDKYENILVRDSVYLQWRFKGLRLKAARCFVATDHEGEIVAYIVFRSSSLKRLDVGMILELLIEPSERGRAAGNQLVALATHDFQEDRQVLGICLMLGHTDEVQVLRDQGYIPCPRSLEPHPLKLTSTSFGDRVSLSDILPKERWFFTLGDWGIDSASP